MHTYLAGLGLSLRLMRRRLILLVAVALLTALLGQVAAQALADVFSGKSELTGLRIALCGPGAQTAANLTGQMEDIRTYCVFEAVEDEAAARAEVQSGAASAAVVLPEGFLDSIYSGENLAPTLILDETHPLEGYLARWAGECAIGLLMDAQTGVTAVREAYQARRAAGDRPEKSQKKVIEEINLVYIQAALGRSDVLRTTTVTATGALAPGDHYALSALAYLALLSGAVFFPLFEERSRRDFLRRLDGVGQSLLPLRLAALSVCAVLLAAALSAALAALGGMSWAGVLAGAVFAAGLAGACAAWTGHAGTCSLALFLLATAALFLSGGILPPALLPGPLRALLPFSPVRLLALALSPACGYDSQPVAVLALAVCGAALWALALFAAHRRHRKEVGA